MKASDHDLEKMFKLEQEHSVLAACRAIYDLGYKHARDDMVPEPDQLVPEPEPAPPLHPVTMHAVDLIHAAGSL